MALLATFLRQVQHIWYMQLEKKYRKPDTFSELRVPGQVPVWRGDQHIPDGGNGPAAIPSDIILARIIHPLTLLHCSGVHSYILPFSSGLRDKLWIDWPNKKPTFQEALEDADEPDFLNYYSHVDTWGWYVRDCERRENLLRKIFVIRLFNTTHPSWTNTRVLNRFTGKIDKCLTYRPASLDLIGRENQVGQIICRCKVTKIDHN